MPCLVMKQTMLDLNICSHPSIASLIPTPFPLVMPHQFESLKNSLSLPPLPFALSLYEAQIPTNLPISFSSTFSYSSSSFFSMHDKGWLNYRSHYPLNFWPIGEQMTQEMGMPMPIYASSYATTMKESGHNNDTANETFDTFPLTLEVSGSWQEIEPKKNEKHSSLENLSKKQRVQERIERFAHNCYIWKSSSTYSSRDVATSFISNKLIPYTKQKLTFLLTKKLSTTDVNVSRIILPKWDVEDHLPYLRSKQGIHFIVRDIFSSDAWKMRFRFWSNNDDRMYLLGNTGGFIRKYNLECGDFIALYQDESENFHYICFRRSNEPLPPSMIRGKVVHSNIQMVMQANRNPEQEQSKGEGSSSGAPNITESGDPMVTETAGLSSTRNGLYIDAQMENINGCNFPEFNEFPDLDKYRLFAPTVMEGSAPTVTATGESSSATNGLWTDTLVENIDYCSIPEFEEFPDFLDLRLSAPTVMECSAPSMTEITEPSSGTNGLCIDAELENSNSCNLPEFKEFSEFFDEHGPSTLATQGSASTMIAMAEAQSARDGSYNNTQMEMNHDWDFPEFEQFPGFDEYGHSAPSAMEGSNPSMTKTSESSSARVGLHADTQLENSKDCNVTESEEFQGFDEYGLSIYDLGPGDIDDIMLM